MRRTALPFLAAAAFAVAAPAGVSPACTFCGGGLTNRQTLREHFHAAKVVLSGKLRNPRVDPNGVGGTTEFHVEAVLKGDAGVAGRVVVLPQYYPLIGDTPPDYVLFGAVTDGKFDADHVAPGSAAVADYLRATAAVPTDDAVRRLGLAFAHLDAADGAVAGDAFLELAKATDADILRAKAVLDPAKLRKWLADPATPADRLGMYGLLLGAAGSPADAVVIAELVGGPSPLPERVSSNLGGLLAGYLLLDPKAGWAATEAALTAPARPFNERLAAIGTVRFAQATRPETKPAVLACYRAAVRQGDLADLTIDDLRRWAWWDLTADVLAKAETVPPPPPVVRRGVLRYAIACPAEEAKRFVAAARVKEPKLVADVEESIRLFEPRRP